jgi:hypothetical protein
MAGLETRPPLLIGDRAAGILMSANGRSRNSGLARAIAATAKSPTSTHAILFSPPHVLLVTTGTAAFADSLAAGSQVYRVPVSRG